MLLLLSRTRFFSFSSKHRLANSAGAIDSSIEEVLARRQKTRREILERQKTNLPIERSYKAYMDSIVKITLYMRNDMWQSQYLFLLLNWNQLGFRRVSDLVQLDRASYFLGLREVREVERWPSIKVVVALQPKIILSGINSISEFFRENGYFIQDFDRHGAQTEALVGHIDKTILPALESLFWHPKLTFQSLFHTSLSSYEDTSRSYSIFGILGRNFSAIASKTLSNLSNILKDPQRYQNSKADFRDGVKELQKSYLCNSPFFGGPQPSHVDFYLLSNLKTKTGCSLFMDYLERGVGGQFWRWWLRMGQLCHYNPERITTL